MNPEMLLKNAMNILKVACKERIGDRTRENQDRKQNTEEGFDFVGFNIKRVRRNPKGNYKKKLLKEWKEENQKRQEAGRKLKPWNEWKIQITPSAKSVKNHIAKLREIFRTHKAVSQEVLIMKLIPVINGWANYNKFVDAGKAFSKCDYYLYHRYMRWIARKHPNKSTKWRVAKYFQKVGNYAWTFAKNKECYAPLHSMTKGKVMSYAKVQAGKSYYDGDMVYWAARLSKGYGNITASKARLLKKQNGRCALCNAKFQDGDIMETHHKQRKADGGGDNTVNLCLVHGHCHDRHHRHDRGEPHKVKIGTHKFKYIY